MTRRLLALLRLLPAADAAALAYAVTYTAWVLLHDPAKPYNRFIADASFLPLGLTVCWQYLRNANAARRDGLDRRTQIAWRLLAVEAAGLWISGVAWTYFVAFTGPAGTPPWVEALEYVEVLFTIAAALTFPGLRPLPRPVARFWLDTGLVVVAAFVLAFHYGTNVVSTMVDIGRVDIVFVRAALDWLVFIALSVGVFHKRDHVARVAVGWLLIANAMGLAGNWILSSTTGYQAGDPEDLLWFSAWVAKWIAARYAWHTYSGVKAPRGTRVWEERIRTALPHALVASAFALLTYQVLANPEGELSVFAYSAGAMTALLVLRQVAELRENRRLFASQLAQEARFRSLVQHASDVVLVLDAGRRVTYASPSVTRVLGADAIPLGAPLADLLPADDAAALAPLFARTTATLPRLQTRMRTATGEARDVELVATDLRHDPAVAGVVLNCRDVTERNELERQLHHAQKLDAVGHLAGGLAHDFNNVLTAIRGYTELLREDLPAGSPADADLRHIEQAVDRAAAVTKKLLAFSRKQAIQPVVVDLNTVLRDLDPLLRQLVTDRIDVRTDLDPALWPLKADPGQLEQVVINLATNARDAMPAGGTLHLSTANRVVTAASPETGPLAPGAYVALVVADQGLGMPPAVHARIFEPFFSTKTADRGMGLGLAMVHGIVTHAGGHITVESVEGHGTTFTLLLPRTADPLRTPAARVPLPALRPDARRILLVDDELGVRTVARRMLERAGYDVVEAPDGHAALARLVNDALEVDLLLTDMVMPGLHGRDLIARVRALRPGLPIVCITGYAGEAPGLGDLAPLVAAVVTKPFASDVLLRSVAAALRVS